MCGIAGILGRTDPEAVRRMVAAMTHRGPDDEGFLDEEGACLGMRRLSIIDLETGRQPLRDESGRLALVLNGEVYNHRELRAELEERGHRFATRTDAEVVVHLYEEFGRDCLERLRGMFAFCLWDHRERTALLARDRLGIKPLYLVEQPGRLAFASEVRALLAAGLAERRLEPRAVASYVGFPCIPEPTCIVPGVRALLPGHALTYRDGRAEQHRYWSLRFPREPEPIPEAEAVERVRSVLDDAVRLRMISDVPLGAFLSGGIDSSSLVGFMGRHSDRPVRTFSVRFTGDDPEFRRFDEGSYAREVADRVGTEHREILATGADVLAKLPRMIWAMDQPSGDALQYYLVSEAARTGVTVAISGTGGDELFAGYEWFKEMALLERIGRGLDRVPEPLLRGFEGLLARAPRPLRSRGPLRRLHTVLRGRGDPVERYRLRRRLYRPEELPDLLRPEWLEGSDPGSDEIQRHAEAVAGLNPVALVSHLQLMTDLPNLLIKDTDVMSMAHSLEVRLPLVDHLLVEEVARLPSNLKLREGTEKYLLRQVAAPVLPPRVASRRKQGFVFPMHLWMRRELAPVVERALAPERIERRGIFRPEAVSGLLRRFQAGGEPFFKLWNLVSLELWCCLHLDHAMVEPPAPELTWEDLL